MARILVFTGEGKGKTTAALGIVLRAVGHGMPVYCLQFLKDDRDVGEWRTLGSMPGVTVEQCGRGFVPRPTQPNYAEHQAAAQEGLSRLRQVVADPAWHICVFDELCGAISLGLLDVGDVLDALRAAATDKVLVVTGRGAPPELVALADTVTEMVCHKHGYESGIPAQKGVEF